jgi:Na+-driven multidrug efflux pump
MGTALATVISQGVSLFASFVILFKRRDVFGFDFKLKSFGISKEHCGIILRIGFPLAAESGVMQITQLFIMSHINIFGLIQAAAYGIGEKIIQLLNVVQQSMKMGGGAIVGQNIGAEKPERVKKIVGTILRVTLCISTVLSGLILIFPRFVFSLFTQDPAVLAYSFSFMLITSLCLFLASILCAYSSVTTGTGNSKLAFLAGFLDGVIFRIAFGFLFGFTFHMEVTGFFLGNILARLGPMMVHCPYYFTGAWERRKRLID